jgi:CheY-like chemotaxis protein
MVFGVARQSGGGVALVSAPGEGTTITVYLPRARKDAVRERGPAAAPRPGSTRSRHAVVLLVEDDADVREVTVALLNAMGYEVLEAASGAEALDLLAAEARVDVMLVDIAMPGMDGIETSRRARQLRPDLSILFATGYTDVSRFAEHLAKERVIRKPYRRAELADKLRVSLGRTD